MGNAVSFVLVTGKITVYVIQEHHLDLYLELYFGIRNIDFRPVHHAIRRIYLHLPAALGKAAFEIIAVIYYAIGMNHVVWT